MTQLMLDNKYGIKLGDIILNKEPGAYTNYYVAAYSRWGPWEIQVRDLCAWNIEMIDLDAEKWENLGDYLKLGHLHSKIEALAKKGIGP